MIEINKSFNDSKSSYLDISKKLSLSNSLLDFSSNIDLFFPKMGLHHSPETPALTAF